MFSLFNKRYLDAESFQIVSLEARINPFNSEETICHGCKSYNIKY